MGACLSCQRVGNGMLRRRVDRDGEDEYEGIVGRGDYDARVRLHGSSTFISMYSKQGKKGINQDAMTVWENFRGQKDAYFCGVFDGHGPCGHKVSRFIRDTLPSKLSLAFKLSNVNNNSEHSENGDPLIPLFYKCKTNFIKSFREMDDELEAETMIDAYYSGTTAVTLLKQGEHLVIGNVGDSRAIICKRDNTDQLIAEQLTVDLKPNLPSEFERIMRANGRVMAMEEEPNVHRIWMPYEDGPGLAMARAFGDFCLKSYGLISVPEMYYRKLTDTDEFIVLATDGIWDVLSNDEVIKTVASAKKRSTAARVLVERAVRAWKHRYPCARTDDCAVICLFLKDQRPMLTSTSTSSSPAPTELSSSYPKTDDDRDTVLNCKVKKEGQDGA